MTMTMAAEANEERRIIVAAIDPTLVGTMLAGAMLSSASASTTVAVVSKRCLTISSNDSFRPASAFSTCHRRIVSGCVNAGNR